VEAIVVENVSKVFRIPTEKKTTVFENLLDLLKGKKFAYEELQALKDVSFTVERGETLGIIGENGSGKSTLLKILASVLWPDSGSVKVNGRVAPFLELGVGFQPELTARENVYLYGAIMGMKKGEIRRKYDNIFAFAELKKFENMKLKNFSTGMYMRLAFSTAIATDPDILLVDEVLAVGDEAFQRKCLEKFDEFKRNGKTIVFVSHNMDAVKNLCERAILLNNGKIASIGPTEKVVSDYFSLLQKREEEKLREEHQRMQEEITELETASVSIEEPVAKEPVPPQEKSIQPNRWGSREVEITEVKFLDKDGKETHIFRTGDFFGAEIKYNAKRRIEKPVFGVAIYKDDGTHVTGPNTRFSNYTIDFIDGLGKIIFAVDKLPLLDGAYKFSAAIYDHSCRHPFDHHHCVYDFMVQNRELVNYGMLDLRGRWELIK
jgi:lipopolysaccharide transport system ATP-binding protein